MTLSDSKASIDATGLCDDGSDESIASTTLAERAVIKGFGKIEAIDTDWLEVALTEKNNKPKLYKFSRAWCAPSTVLHLNSGRLALKNIHYLVADDSMACEDLFFGRPVLLHLRVDTRSFLEDRVATLDGTDCSLDALPRTKGGRVSRRMLAHIIRVGNDKMDDTDQPTADSARRKVNYFSARAEEDPLPDPSLLDPIDQKQHDDIKATVSDLQKTAFDNGQAEDKRPRLATWKSSARRFLRDRLRVSRRSRLSLLPTPSPSRSVCATVRRSNATF